MERQLGLLLFQSIQLQTICACQHRIASLDETCDKPAVEHHALSSSSPLMEQTLFVVVLKCFWQHNLLQPDIVLGLWKWLATWNIWLRLLAWQEKFSSNNSSIINQIFSICFLFIYFFWGVKVFLAFTLTKIELFWLIKFNFGVPHLLNVLLANNSFHLSAEQCFKIASFSFKCIYFI